ncbi:MAG: family 10 glycosylhydrolase [Ignavibacteriaceae bacterium]
MIRFFTVLFFTIFICARADAGSKSPKREFRGAWIATITNIDWPSDKNLSSFEQINELKEIFSNLKLAGINAVFFQIRTECDAFYQSMYEPWSYWLTGKQGRAPFPFYDPLELAISEAHKYGMELHAWLNPFRVSRNGKYDSIAENHIAIKHPDWILDFGKYKMLNPGLPEVRNYLKQIVTDIVQRYDVDGITFDDYFYPYEPLISGQDFSTFRIYGSGFSNIKDWRRNNINVLISEINTVIKSVKPWVKFGISPFGIVKNKYAGTRGLDSYSTIYSDPLSWINSASIDYVIPQLYWEIGKKSADYSKLLSWWAEICNNTHLFIGHYATRMSDPLYGGLKSELSNQIRLNRKTKNVMGSAFFSAGSIVKNSSGFADTLRNSFYRSKALLPRIISLDTIASLPPVNPVIEQSNKNYIIRWDSSGPAEDGELPRYFILYFFRSEEKIDLENPETIIDIIPSGQNSYKIDSSEIGDDNFIIAITSADRNWNESLPVILRSEESILQ